MCDAETQHWRNLYEELYAKVKPFQASKELQVIFFLLLYILYIILYIIIYYCEGCAEWHVLQFVFIVQQVETTLN